MFAGAGRRIINPEKGHPLFGYGPTPNEGVHDDLAATALFISSADSQAVLINYDLLWLVSSLQADVRAAISAATGVPVENVFVTCTHTHSGPATRAHANWRMVEPNDFEEPYSQRVIQWSAQAAAEAKAAAVECTLHYNYDFAAENMNRRYLFPDRSSLYVPFYKQLAGRSSEFVDRELGIVALRREGSANRYVALITNYAAHPLCVGNSSNMISADYQGYLRRTVEETLSGCLCLATTGAAGDNHPLMPESGFEQARKMGSSLGTLAITRLFDSVQCEDEELRLAVRPITLKAKDEATRALLPYESDRARPAGRRTAGLAEIQTSYGLLGIGPILLVAQPAEMVAELGQMIKWSSPFLKTYVLFLSSDAGGYMAATNQFLWGAYEPVISPYAADAGVHLTRRVAETAWELLRQRPLNLPPTQGPNPSFSRR